MTVRELAEKLSHYKYQDAEVLLGCDSNGGGNCLYTDKYSDEKNILMCDYPENCEYYVKDIEHVNGLKVNTHECIRKCWEQHKLKFCDKCRKCDPKEIEKFMFEECHLSDVHLCGIDSGKEAIDEFAKGDFDEKGMNKDIGDMKKQMADACGIPVEDFHYGENSVKLKDLNPEVYRYNIHLRHMITGRETDKIVLATSEDDAIEHMEDDYTIDSDFVVDSVEIVDRDEVLY